MARIKAKSKARKTKRKTNVKRRKKVYSKSGLDSFNKLLDRTITVRTLLKYSTIVLLFVLVVSSAFLLGRASARSNTLSSQQVTELSSDPSDAPEIDAAAELEEAPVKDTDNSEEDKKDTEEPAPIEEVAEVEEYYFEAEPEPKTEPIKLKIAEFGFNYSKVFADATDFQKNEKGVNWATLESLRLTIRNDEDSTIINPTRIKIKMNNKGKGSVWWDDEVWLSDSFKDLRPGQEATEIIPVHVSYSDIYQEKDFRLVVLDDYDVPIVYVKKIMVLK